MEHPLYVLIEITEGIFEIWSRTGNIQENVAIFAQVLPWFSPSKWVKNRNFFKDISSSRPNFKNPFGYFTQNIERVGHEKFQGPTMFLLGCRGGPKIGESVCTIKGQTVELSGYDMIPPDFTHFNAHFANFGAFWSFESLLKVHEGTLGTPNQFFHFT
jgi:hypothetical protein